MKKIIAIVILIFIIVLGVIVFKPKENNNMINIGAVIPLTGNYAPIGEKIKNGLEMAKSDLEKQFPGKSIKILYEDGCLAKDVTSAVQKLITINDIKIINQFCAIGLVPSLEITEKNKIINVGVAANVDDLMGRNFYLSPNFAVRDNAVTIADFAINNLHAKKAAFIYYNTQFGKDYRKYIGAEFEKLGGQIVADEMTSLDITDFRTNLTKIRDAKPDVIFVTQLTGALGTIIKQTKDLNINAPLVGNYQNEDPVVLSVAGKAAEGFIISSADPIVLSKEFGNDFRENFKKVHGTWPDVFASNAYDALQLEVNAYIKCQDNTECLRDKLHQTKDYHGVSGTITIDANGVAAKPTIFKIVRDGKFVEYK